MDALAFLARRGVLPIRDALDMDWGFVYELYKREVEMLRLERRAAIG